MNYTIKKTETIPTMITRYYLEDFGPIAHEVYGYGPTIDLVIVSVEYLEEDDFGPECVYVHTSLRGYDSTVKGARDKRSVQRSQFASHPEYEELRKDLARQVLAEFLEAFPQYKGVEVMGLKSIEEEGAK